MCFYIVFNIEVGILKNIMRSYNNDKASEMATFQEKSR